MIATEALKHRDSVFLSFSGNFFFYMVATEALKHRDSVFLRFRGNFFFYMIATEALKHRDSVLSFSGNFFLCLSISLEVVLLPGNSPSVALQYCFLKLLCRDYQFSL